MMRRAAAILTTSLLVGVLFLAYSGVVSAGHLVDTAPQANLLGNCAFVGFGTDFLFEGAGATSVPADTAFWVGHGWFTDVPYKDLDKDDRKAFDSKATTFELAVDGELQQLSERRVSFIDFDGIEGSRLKLFYYDFHGMSGTHTFTGMWYVDGLDPIFGNGIYKDKIGVLRCVIDVTFVP